jgi:2,3-dihydro-2,3-dihydroxybenzoate dehydrogenase
MPTEPIRTAIVTGATQGIGKAIALALLQEGRRVIAVGRSPDKLDALAAEAGDARDRLVPEPLDICDGARFEARLQDWIARWGGLSYLVNAAGILDPGRLLDTPRDSLRRIIETNLVATLETTLAVARHMAGQRAGSIVTIGSNSGTTARYGLGAYPASKAGIIHAMKCLGLELAEYGVRCNIVSPGSTDTEMQRRYQTAATSREAMLKGDPGTYRLGIPLGRMAEPRDISDLVLFLLSDRARHITMENIVIDGGATMGAR